VPLTGAGQIVGVADTGFDQAHPDFTGRVIEVVALGRPNNASDPHGHVTHVAGSILADGSASICPANFHQGFGEVNLTTSLPNPEAPNLQLEFIDCWQSPNLQLDETGERRRFHLDVEAGMALRLRLAYTDLPGRSLQNDVSVMVQDRTGKKIAGNSGLPTITNSDVDNNVEVIRVDDPAPGRWLIQSSRESTTAATGLRAGRHRRPVLLATTGGGDGVHAARETALGRSSSSSCTATVFCSFFSRRALVGPILPIGRFMRRLISQ
jgi:subtilisin family serine protease